jgi:hypothetical protein
MLLSNTQNHKKWRNVLSVKPTHFSAPAGEVDLLPLWVPEEKAPTWRIMGFLLLLKALEMGSGCRWLLLRATTHHRR